MTYVPDFSALNDLMDDDEESLEPTEVHVYYRERPQGALKELQIPGTSMSVRFGTEDYGAPLRRLLQSHVDTRDNGGAAAFLFMNRTRREAPLEDWQTVTVRVPRHIHVAVEEKLLRVLV